METQQIQKTTEKITKEMTIGDFVQQYPSVVEILLDEGVHCVGCGAAYYETIEQGLASHGKTGKEINDCIKRMNEAIPKEDGDDQTVIITDKAANKLKEMLKEKEKGTALRISVSEGGCSGFQYEFLLDSKVKKDDNAFEISGVKLIIDKQSLSKIKGSKLDYLDSLTGAGFKISNPNATSTCGCGQSFN